MRGQRDELIYQLAKQAEQQTEDQLKPVIHLMIQYARLAA
jgi:hypothetical protein